MLQLQESGCLWEEGKGKALTVPSPSLEKVKRLLTHMQQHINISFISVVGVTKVHSVIFLCFKIARN